MANIKVKTMCAKAFKGAHNVDDFLYDRIELWLEKAYELGCADGYAGCLYERIEEEETNKKE